MEMCNFVIQHIIETLYIL